MSDDDNDAPDPPSAEELQDALTRGMMAFHNQASLQWTNVLELTTRLVALAEVLVQKGLITLPEVEAQMVAVRPKVQAKLSSGLQFIMQPEVDKYTAPTLDVNCDERRPHCRTACCGLDAAVSTQDLNEGLVRWDTGRPYLLRRLDDGLCCHLERGTGGCTVYDKRPVVCRVYSCAGDKRIWLDFEKMVPNKEGIDLLLARHTRPVMVRPQMPAPPAPAASITVTGIQLKSDEKKS